MTDEPKKRKPGRPKGTTKEAMKKRLLEAMDKKDTSIHNKSKLSEDIKKYAGKDAKKMLEALLETAETRAEAKLIAKDLIQYQHAKLANVESRQIQDTTIEIKWLVDDSPKQLKDANEQVKTIDQKTIDEIVQENNEKSEEKIAIETSNNEGEEE